ncbi:RNA polymerase sigma factor [Streptomyces sp. NBC_00091]|uniref:RNA polymerase sigma factor n=1 Tax=Streptomyces sp. NBC_00091 TaxID=2975648 RepID=UPI00225089EF|nr:sigma-70 family RNA polymerase sigma factor [Streptomyces sp. NBC_00091]MCX5380354.1 sigma-70 family RNA polymerase sigma factor [Streptomyces sp. NBC_00091]
MTVTESPTTAFEAGPQQRRPTVRMLRDDFDTLYIKEMRAVTVHLMYRGATAYEAADAVHEAFIELLPDRWRTIAHPRAYLRTVAWTKYLRQAHHRESPEDPVPDRPGGTCPVREVILTETQQRILAAVQQLPPAQREVIAWQLDEFEYAEIARFTGKKETALRTNAKRGRERLKVLLDLARTGRSEGGSSDE